MVQFEQSLLFPEDIDIAHVVTSDRFVRFETDQVPKTLKADVVIF